MSEGEGLQRNIFPWIGYDDPFKDRQEGIPSHKTITAEEVVKKHGVPREELQKHIQKEIEESKNFWSLPFTLFFVTAFALFVFSHDNAIVIRAVQDSIEFDIIENANWRFESNGNMGHKGIEDISTVADFYSWATQGFIPLIFQQSNSFAELRNTSLESIQAASIDFKEDQRGVLLNFNRIIGGVRFTQQRSPEIKCRSAGMLKDFYPGPCYGKKDGYELDPETWTVRAPSRPDNVTWFYAFEDQDKMIERLRIMEATQWIDAATSRVEISLPVYNAEFGLHTMVSINFLFSRGGEIWKMMLPHSTYAAWWTELHYIVYDLCWVLALLNILGSELNEIYWFCKHKNFKQFVTEYFNFWNLVDWVSMVFGFAIMVMSLLSFGQTAEVNEETILLADTPWTDMEAYSVQVDAYMKALDMVLRYIHRLKLMLAMYPLIIVLRLFKAFASQPRLALVTNTLNQTIIDLSHFLVVFSSIFTTIAISGLVLFGRQIGEFTTLLRAMNTVFFLMLGDFDYEALAHVGRVEGAMWLFSSIIVLNFLMLNIVLAIVMDGYSVVKANSAGGDTLFEEIGQTWSRFWNERRGEWVPLGVILDALLRVEVERRVKDLEFHLEMEEGNVKAHLQSIVGIDSKAMLGMRVLPRDSDIAHFVGEGKISRISVTQLEVRVLHDDGQIRQYDTGKDLNFELALAPGETAVEFSHDGEDLDQQQLISPERLMKLVQAHNRKYRMQYKQALDLCMDTVAIYYKTNSEEVDLDMVLQTARKVKFRVQKISRIVDEGFCQTLTSTAPQTIRNLRQLLQKTYKKVDEERQIIHEKMNQLRRDIAELEDKLGENEAPAPTSLHEELPKANKNKSANRRYSVETGAMRRRSMAQQLREFSDFDENEEIANSLRSSASDAPPEKITTSVSSSSRDAREQFDELARLSESARSDRLSESDQSDVSDSVIGMGHMDDDELLAELDFALQDSFAIRHAALPESNEERRRKRMRDHPLPFSRHTEGERREHVLHDRALMDQHPYHRGSSHHRERSADRDRRYRSSASDASYASSRERSADRDRRYRSHARSAYDRDRSADRDRRYRSSASDATGSTEV